MSEIEYHQQHMLLPTVSQDTLGQWEAIITIKHIAPDALAADYKLEASFENEAQALQLAIDHGKTLIDDDTHASTVLRKAAMYSKPA